MLNLQDGCNTENLPKGPQSTGLLESATCRRPSEERSVFWSDLCPSFGVIKDGAEGPAINDQLWGYKKDFFFKSREL